MRVLVTGANGFVGRHLCAHLREHGDEVIPACGPEGGPEGPAMDVTDAESVRSVVAGARPEVVIHLAGFSSVASSHAHPGQAFAVNTLGAVHLLAALRDLAPRARVLLVGSGEMYGRLDAADAASEDLPLRPLSPYAASKAAAEIAGFQFQRSTTLEVIALRPFNHIGPGQDRHFVVPSFARRIVALRQGGGPRILNTGDLSPVRDFLHVSDVVAAYRIVASRGKSGEAYNVSSGTGRTIGSLLEEMLRLAGVEARAEVDPSLLRAVELPSSIGDSSKLRRLGWSPSRTVHDALREVLEEAARQP